MTNELREKLDKANLMSRYKKCCKALCLVGDIHDAYLYLCAIEDSGTITGEEADKIMEQVEKELADVTYKEIKEIRSKF